MKKLLLAALSLLLLGSLAATPALMQNAKAQEAAPVDPGKPAPIRHARKTQPVDSQGRPLSTVPASKRIALCKADCTPNNYKASTGIGIHGIYRSYAEFDPQIKSAEGIASFNECVKKCSDPLPEKYVQRAVFGLGLNWFGHTKQSCLDCHARGH